MKQKMKPADYLVAHRGDRAGGVENTLAAFARAAAAGARFAECDIQFTREFIPVVMHDHSLARLCYKPATHITKSTLPALTLACNSHFKLLTLNEMLLWLLTQPQLTMFVEIKPDISKRLSPVAVAALLAGLLPAHKRSQLVLISESGRILDACKARFNCRTGWVDKGKQRPEHVPDYVFMPFTAVDTIPAWHAQGVQAGLYTINDSGIVADMLAGGADLIETDHYSRMLADIDDA